MCPIAAPVPVDRLTMAREIYSLTQRRTLVFVPDERTVFTVGSHVLNQHSPFHILKEIEAQTGITWVTATASPDRNGGFACSVRLSQIFGIDVTRLDLIHKLQSDDLNFTFDCRSPLDRHTPEVITDLIMARLSGEQSLYRMRLSYPLEGLSIAEQAGKVAHELIILGEKAKGSQFERLGSQFMNAMAEDLYPNDEKAQLVFRRTVQNQYQAIIMSGVFRTLADDNRTAQR